MNNKDYMQLRNVETIINNIVLKIIENQNLLRCLKYNTKNALSPSLPDLTQSERYDMIDEESEDCRIFSVPFYDNTIEEERSELRIFISNLNPKNIVISNIAIQCEIIVHNRLWKLDDGKQRPLVIMQELLKTLNGGLFNGIGALNFENSRIAVYSKYFSGYTFTTFIKTV